MRLLKILLSILLLRRLPGGRLMSWLLRLGIWSWLISQAIKKLKPHLESAPADYPARPPSGWSATTGESAAPAEAFESPPLSTTAATTPAETTAKPENMDTVTETAGVTTAIWGAPTDETGGIETAPTAAAPKVAREQEDEPEPEPQSIPRWIQGDGTVDCPDDFPIKAKATSMIYYQPGSYHYSVTYADVCFGSPEDAVAAGYRAPKR